MLQAEGLSWSWSWGLSLDSEFETGGWALNLMHAAKDWSLNFRVLFLAISLRSDNVTKSTSANRSCQGLLGFFSSISLSWDYLNVDLTIAPFFSSITRSVIDKRMWICNKFLSKEPSYESSETYHFHFFVHEQTMIMYNKRVKNADSSFPTRQFQYIAEFSKPLFLKK